MGEYKKDKEEVQKFLDQVKELLAKPDSVQINIVPWKGNRVNKTLAYMAETGISQKDIEEVIRELQVIHYSYTADDRNMHFKDEHVWVFGITKRMVDQNTDLYIKLKIRTIGQEILLIMSFHPESPGCNGQKLEFPYKE